MEDIFVYDAGQPAPIEGLEELRKAIAAKVKYQVNRERFNNGELLEMPEKPKPSVEEVKAQYPRAAAYIEAEQWSNSAGFKKSVLGREAMRRISAGEDHTMVLEEMKGALAAWKLAQEG